MLSSSLVADLLDAGELFQMAEIKYQVCRMAADRIITEENAVPIYTPAQPVLHNNISQSLF